MKQVVRVLRVQLLDVRFRLGIPLAALGVVIALDLALFGAIGPVEHPQDRFTGAPAVLYLTICVVYVQVSTQVFRLSLSLGVTRRAFCAAVALLAVLEAIGYGALLVLLRVVELATGGWGLQLEFFRLDQLGERTDLLLHGVVYAVPVLVVAAVGAFIGAVFARWAGPGVLGLAIGTVVLPAAVAVLINGLDRWAALVAWVADQPPLVLSTAYPLALAALLGGAGWLVLRRATT